MLSFSEIGERISIARKMKNLSQSQLAELISVSAQAVGKWERGESMPDIVTFGRLAEILDVDLNYFGGIGNALSGFQCTHISDEEEKLSQKPGWNMSGGNWVDVDFSGLNGLAEKFKGANIENCQFVDSGLSALQLKGNNIRQCDFTRSDLSECKFSGTNLEQNIFVGCNFGKSEFSRTNIKNCDFSSANLEGVVSRWSQYNKVKLSGAILVGTTFQYGQLTDIIFDGEIVDCAFENCDFARVEYNGSTIRNTFFKNCKLKRAKFTDCKADKLSYAFMKTCKADLSGIEIIE